MELREYLFKRRISAQKFASVVGCHPCYLSGVASGRVRPSKHIAKIIQFVTKGEVTIPEVMNAKEQRKKFEEETKLMNSLGENEFKF